MRLAIEEDWLKLSAQIGNFSPENFRVVANKTQPLGRRTVCNQRN
jgi:hypothetical protein